MIIVSDYLQLGHWQLVIRNKSFERVFESVEFWEFKSVCNGCLKWVFVMRMIESVWDENIWEYLRWEYLRVFEMRIFESVCECIEWEFECSGMFWNVLECFRMF